MCKPILIMLVLLLTACAGHGSSSVPLKYSGPVTAQALTDRYNHETSLCRPFDPGTAFSCSGIVIRGTSHSTQYHSWNPNPASTGMSFAYLRKDAKFTSLYIYKNGFIFYSKTDTPAGKINIPILCFFPRDGATNIREDEGCGQSPGTPTSRECQAQGITTAEQWVEHYRTYGSYGDMCGFNVRDTLGDAAVNAFNQGLRAQRLIFDESFKDYNELRLSKWGQDLGKVLPIQAFFYLSDLGKAAAQYDQRDFLNETGISLPIIYLRLPVEPSDEALFRFIPEDQGIPLG
ncbi:hypothetical protein IM720_20285 [Pseudomonas fluorescens]|uniref:Halovibrin HvnA n=1 Tax=Pseudomonas fluorescens TaxID=294 RepID=A0A7M2J094_PSEFL|nr:hypothetical protein [Pseudomonas fluorescens]QOU03051.1 hypothetical protein IM720_20285 [Pseudomonas fluorescens]